MLSSLLRSVGRRLGLASGGSQGAAGATRDGGDDAPGTGNPPPAPSSSVSGVPVALDTPAAGRRRLFVIRDMTIRGIDDVLEDLCHPLVPHRSIDEAFTHGMPEDGPAQGAIGTDVYSRIDHATHVIALMDHPNANVGYEVGYALATGKPVALAQVRDDLPKWGDSGLFSDFFPFARANDLEKLLEIARGDSWNRLARCTAGRKTVFLCPDEGIGKKAMELLRVYRRNWQWLPLMHLDDLPGAMAGVGRVLWVIVPPVDSAGQRDGPANAANAVVAGYARGLGLDLVVLTHKEHDAVRPIQDIRAIQRLWKFRKAFLDALPPLSEEDGPSALAVRPSPVVAAPPVPAAAARTRVAATWPPVTIAQSVQRRPAWAQAWGDAPQAAAEVLKWATPTGNRACRDGMLVCAISSTLMRARFLLGSLPPNLEATVSWSGRSVAGRGPDRSSAMHVTAPLADVDPGAVLRIRVDDRHTFSTQVLTTVELPCTGFPVAFEGEDLAITCGYVDRGRLEEALGPLVAAAAAAIERLGKRMLAGPSASLAGQGDAEKRRLAEAASLVGWAHPSVASLVQALDVKLEAYRADLARQVAERCRELPDGWTEIGKVEWRPGTLVTDAAAERPGWTVRVPMRPSAQGSRHWMDRSLSRQPELIDARGAVWSLGEVDFNAETDPEKPIVYRARAGAPDVPGLPAVLRVAGAKVARLQRVG